VRSAEQGLVDFKHWRRRRLGRSWQAGHGFPLRDLGLASSGVFVRDVARRLQGQGSTVGLVRTILCRREGDLRQANPVRNDSSRSLPVKQCA
jgi:hypothetical protein